MYGCLLLASRRPSPVVAGAIARPAALSPAALLFAALATQPPATHSLASLAARRGSEAATSPARRPSATPPRRRPPASSTAERPHPPPPPPPRPAPATAAGVALAPNPAAGAWLDETRAPSLRRCSARARTHCPPPAPLLQGAHNLMHPLPLPFTPRGLKSGAPTCCSRARWGFRRERRPRACHPLEATPTAALRGSAAGLRG
jgi:hypothetical protein